MNPVLDQSRVLAPEPETKPVVLVVDDQDANRQLLRRHLEQDYTVVTAINGRNGVELALQIKPDLILLDLVMPEMDGEEACGLLKADPSTRGVPVIFVTSQVSPEQEALCLTWGAVDFISKPVNRKVLQARVKTHLDLSTTTQRLRQNEERLTLAANVFNHANESILITDAQGMILDINQTYCHATGFERAEVIGTIARFLRPSPQEPATAEVIWKALRSQGHWAGEVTSERKNGLLYPELIKVSAIQNDESTPRYLVALLSDISSLKEKQRELEFIAHFDVLTRLPNRTLLADRLKHAMASSVRRNECLAVAFLDLDGFKAVNDHHGHQAGDRLLVAIAESMKAVLRTSDCIARFGGDEFVMVLPDLAHPDECIPVLRRLLAAAHNPVEIGDLTLSVSASIGVTVYPQDNVDADLLIRHADQAMYLAKQNGKNHYHFYDVVKEAAVRAEIASLGEVRLALAREEFVLHYQPKVSMKTGNVIGVEALLRWNHPERGMLYPASFLPVIENNPISINIGEWVISNVLQQMTLWAQQGLTLPVSVNVGGLQLQQPGFLPRLESLMAVVPVNIGRLLSLEILETSALSDVERLSRLIENCRDLGVKFSLDDFGTGYSSLSYLKSLPAQQLKIDQTFVRGMATDPNDLAIVKGVIGLAQAFNRSVIAEGVETLEDGARLLRLGCELGQGYAIARPMPAERIPHWVANWTTPQLWQKQIYVQRDPAALLDQWIQRVPMAMAVINAAGNYDNVNKAYCTLFGYTRSDLLGKNFTLLFPPDEQGQVQQRHLQFINEGFDIKGTRIALRKDGTRIETYSESMRVPGDGDLPMRLVFCSQV